MPRKQGTRAFPAKRDPLAVARRVLIVVVAIAVIVVGVLIVSHRKSPSNATGPQTTTSVAQTAPGSGAHQKVVPVPLATTLTLARVAQESQKGASATFSATYSSKDVPGAPPSVQLEQMPLAQLFRSGSAELITRASDAYYCILGKSPVCRSESAGASPFARLMGLYEASSYEATLRTMDSLLRTGVVYNFSSSQSSIGGEKSDCLSWGHEHSTVHYCVTPGGILTEFTISATGSSLVTFAILLEHYSAHVAPADFQLPGRATLSLPGPKSRTATTKAGGSVA
jgi:hypothetical protein